MSHLRCATHQDETFSRIMKFHSERSLKVNLLEHPLDKRKMDLELKTLQSGSFQVRIKNILHHSSKSAFHAFLYEAGDFEAIGNKLKETNEQFKLNGLMVNASLTETENVLCVAHIPKTYSETDFEDLLKLQGEVTWSFILHNKYIRRLCRFGFVKYADLATANRAQRFLHNKKVNNSHLYCDWLNRKLCTYDDLHSSCIFVQKMPLNYCDFEDFRRIFSVVAKPRYCQIIMNRTQTTGYGIVEFHSVADANETFQALENIAIGEETVDLSFCMPGVKAAVVVNKFDFRSGLLHDPPANIAALRDIQLLCYKNPQENGRYLNDIQKAVKNHVIFKDDEKDHSTAELNKVQEDAINLPAPTTPIALTAMPNYVAPLHVAPHFCRHNENIPLINPDALALAKLITASQPKASGMEHFPQYSGSTALSHIVNESDTFSHAQGQCLTNIRQTNGFNVYSNYPTPVVSAGLNSQNVTTSNLTYSLGLPLERNSQSLMAPYIPKSPVFERINPIGIRSMPYSRVSKAEKHNVKYRPLRKTATNTTSFDECVKVSSPDVIFKLPDYLLNGQITDNVSATQLQYPNHGQKIWDYKQTTPVSKRQSFEQTKVNMKQPHFLPSPEISPNTTPTCIGQHSQGIGGHYADTYFRGRII